MKKRLSLALLSVVLSSTLNAVAVNAQHTNDLATYYVGVDTSATIPFGNYQGLANPNQNRLTFLFNHANYNNVTSSHYHSIGRWTYEGPKESPTVAATNANNRLPESYTGLHLELQNAPAGSPYAGKLISGMPGWHRRRRVWRPRVSPDRLDTNDRGIRGYRRTSNHKPGPGRLLPL